MASAKVVVKGDTIVIELPFKFDGPESKTGKTIVCASTHGNTAVGLPDGRQIKVGVNVYRDK